MPTPRPDKRQPNVTILNIVLLLLALSICACQNRPTNNTVSPDITASSSSSQNTNSVTSSQQPLPTASVYHDVPAETAQVYQALNEGDYQTVISITTGLLTLSDLPSREALQIVLAKAYLAEGQPQQTIDLLEGLAVSGQQDNITITAVGLVANAYELNSQWPQALSAYGLLLSPRPDAPPDIH
jgi:hypothetical protein